MEFTRKTLSMQHYLYVDKEVSLENPAAIGGAMGAAFGEVFGFCGRSGITPESMPITLYMAMPNDGMMRFRGGVFVTADDAMKAEGDVKSDVIPECEVCTTTHVGPYSHMNVSHKALWDYMDRKGILKAMPIWEVYVDDPTQVSEAECRTELYRAIE